jgi:hypothetical protein
LKPPTAVLGDFPGAHSVGRRRPTKTGHPPLTPALPALYAQQNCPLYKLYRRLGEFSVGQISVILHIKREGEGLFILLLL